MASLQQEINENVQSLYVAFFNRAADTDGLNYWYGVGLASGTDDYMYDIADGFAQNPAYDDLYGGMGDEEFVEAVYKNVTNNDTIDQDALDYWTGQAAGDRPHMLVDFTNSVRNSTPTDADGQYRQNYIHAKIETGLTFAGTLGDESNPTNPGNLENDPAYIASKEILAKFETASDIPGIQNIKIQALDYIQKHPTLDMWENQDPTINPVNALVLDEDTANGGQATADDIDNEFKDQTLTFSLKTAPANGVATVDADGAFHYTPNADYNGTDSLELLVTDSDGATSTETVNITVNPVNDAPVAQDGAVSTNELAAVNGTVLATDVDGDTLTYSLDSDATNGHVTMNQDGTFTYTPIGHNADGLDVPDSFTYTVDDGNNETDTATVDVTVKNLNDAPEANDLTKTLDEDGITAGIVAASDFDLPNDTLTYSISNAPVNGVAAIDAATGAFTYVPNADYNGADSIEVTVTDAVGATVYLNTSSPL